MALVIVAATGTPTSARTSAASTDQVRPTPDPAPVGIQRCEYTVQRIKAHRQTVWELQSLLHARRTPISRTQKVRACGYAKWVEGLWWGRSLDWKKEAARRILPTTNDWVTAVAIAQRPFPGTQGWLLGCSGAEGGHSGWVLWRGRPYYPGAEYARTFAGWMVGGPMQYMWPTFKGHYRHALDSLRERGFIVKLPAPDNVDAWRSMSAQALAAGWARWSGNDGSHWSASRGRGC